VKELTGKKIFVTGGTGFVGTRLVETLVLDQGARVTALVNRANAGALRMTRFDIELAYGDIRSPDAMKAATEGAEVVIHMAYGRSGTDEQQRSVTVGGTSALVDAAVANGVSRFVNVGTAAVYFGAPDGVVDETFPRRKWGWVYSDTKLEAEDIVRDACSQRGLPGTIVQVAGVYGPWGDTFTVGPLIQLQSGRVVLVNGGEGVSNATYVDDTVQAILLAAVRPGAVGETFIIKGAGRITRRDLFAAYERMLGYEATVGMTLHEIAHSKRRLATEALREAPRRIANALVRNQEFKEAIKALPIPNVGRKFLKKFKPRKAGGSSIVAASSLVKAEKPLIFPPDFVLPYYAAKVEFSSAKAERILGYQPRYDLASGMAVTEKWARWAGVIKRP
jgi:nucleoside-diphosphate-sugar epimerase